MNKLQVNTTLQLPRPTHAPKSVLVLGGLGNLSLIFQFLGEHPQEEDTAA